MITYNLHFKAKDDIGVLLYGHVSKLNENGRLTSFVISGFRFNHGE